MIWLCACLVDGARYRERLAQLTDDDGDHWTEDAGDCNDAEPDVHPEAAEVCNDVDDDCDGSVDEDLPSWFLDYDKDGHGDAETTVETCDTPSGFVDSDDDCNDDDPEVHPGAAETCNGYDDDCDDLVDGDDDVIEGGVALYTDADKDGFGDDATERLGCAGEKDAVDVGGDCDDTTQAVHPGAEPEICEDGIDTNCDGTGLGCTGSAATADALFYGEATSDEAGFVTASGVDLNGDSYSDLVIGARSNDDAGMDAGAAYIVLGPTSTGERSLATAWTKLTGAAAGDTAGRAVAFAGDVDNDGIEDIAVTAPSHDGTSNVDAGSVFLVSASDLGSGASGLSSVAYGEIRGDQAGDYCGSGVASAGDQDGDGYDDLWIGATGVDAHGVENAGSVFLVPGPLSSELAFVGLEQRAELVGLDYFPSDVGSVLAPADFDGDGLGDIAMGDRYEDTLGYLAGAVFVVTGPVSGSISLDMADATLLSDAAGDELGTSLSSNGDFDGDGRDDLAVGAPKAGTAGEAYLFLGASSIGSWSGTALTTASGTFVSGADDVRGVGSGVANGGDFDNDGMPDVLIGAAESGALGQGAAFIVTGAMSGTLSLDKGGDRVALRMNGESANDGLGTSVGFTGAIAVGSDQGIIISSSILNASGKRLGGAYLVWALGQ